MNYEIKYPDYSRSILSISSSILNKFGVSSEYPTLKELDKHLQKDYKNIVFLILDCMGTKILNENLGNESFLRTHLETSVATIFPSTTVAATTAFHSGSSPWENGWIGWMPYFSEYDDIIEVFTGRQFYTGKQLDIPPFTQSILPYETIYSKIIKQNADVKFHQVFPGFVPNGAKSIEELCENIYRACNTPAKCNLISAYWNDPDHTIHHNGTYSQETKAVLENIDLQIKQLADRVEDTLFIISADHGAVDVEEIYLNEYEELAECLAMPPSIETRFVTFFIKDGKKKFFEQRFGEIFKDKFLFFTKEEFLDSGILGKGTQHYKIQEYFGDFVIVSKSDKSIRYTIDGNKAERLFADHAGITRDEMEVPVIVIAN